MVAGTNPWHGRTRSTTSELLPVVVSHSFTYTHTQLVTG